MEYGLGAGFDLPPAATRLTQAWLMQAWLDPELARDSEVALGKVLTCAARCETRVAFRSFRSDHIIQLQLDAHSFKDEAGKTFAKFLRQVNQRPNALARVSEKKMHCNTYKTWAQCFSCCSEPATTFGTTHAGQNGVKK